jgi:ectoine hydroxylase-related dioxygenase (phytanoyl-CoA dioxygenase family)
MDGWGSWSIKDGVHHVQPPVEVLNKMLTLRLHIDCADEQNGCLKVIPGSHRRGLLQPATIDSLVKNSIAVPCIVNAGDALIMRPHILHASSKATKPNHRRVVHLEYSSYSLPEGFAWA